MGNRLRLVSDGGEFQQQETTRSGTHPQTSASSTQLGIAPKRLTRVGRILTAMRAAARDESGAVTAEYAIVIMAGVAFAGILVAIIRSDAIRTILVGLVENALGTGG